jgi:hypothetical protein
MARIWVWVLLSSLGRRLYHVALYYHSGPIPNGVLTLIVATTIVVMSGTDTPSRIQARR